MTEEVKRKHHGVWSVEQLEPERERIRVAGAYAVKNWVDMGRTFVFIPVPGTARCQVFANCAVDGTRRLINATPMIYSLLTGRHLSNAPLQIRNNDSWKQGVRMQSKIDFKDPGVEKWLAEELRTCAKTVGVELEVAVQVVLLDGRK